jgi:hypothetical protein
VCAYRYANSLLSFYCPAADRNLSKPPFTGLVLEKNYDEVASFPHRERRGYRTSN